MAFKTSIAVVRCFDTLLLSVMDLNDLRKNFPEANLGTFLFKLPNDEIRTVLGGLRNKPG